MGKIATIASWAYINMYRQETTQEQLIDFTLDRLTELENSGVDLVCLPEEMLLCKEDNDNPNWAKNNAILFERLCERAKKMRVNIAFCLQEPSDKYPGKRYNTAYWANREGDIIAKYRKRHITYRELARDGLPGEKLSAFDTDIGRVGMLICFDIGWRDDWRILAEDGAELVVWMSAYDGGSLLNAYAAHHMYFVVSSVWTTCARIIDPMGRTIEQSSRWNGLAMARVNLGMELFHTDLQVDKIPAIRRALGKNVFIRSYSEENIFTIECSDPEWSMERIKQEFGLRSYKDYHAEYTRQNAEALARYPE